MPLFTCTFYTFFLSIPMCLFVLINNIFLYTLPMSVCICIHIKSASFYLHLLHILSIPMYLFVLINFIFFVRIFSVRTYYTHYICLLFLFVHISNKVAKKRKFCPIWPPSAPSSVTRFGKTLSIWQYSASHCAISTSLN